MDAGARRCLAPHRFHPCWSPTGGATSVELQSVDGALSRLYGTLRFAPELAGRSDRRGAMGATVWYSTACWPSDWPPEAGDRIQLGNASLEVRALIVRQPDPQSACGLGGPPVADLGRGPCPHRAAAARQPAAYRPRACRRAGCLAGRLFDAFPDSEAEVRTFLPSATRLGKCSDESAQACC